MTDERKTDNFSMRTFLETIENIVGVNGLKSVLNYAHLQKYIGCFPPDNEELVIPLKGISDYYDSLRGMKLLMTWFALWQRNLITYRIQ